MTRAPFSWGMLLSLLCFIVCTNSYDPGMDAFLQQDSVLNSSHVDPGPALDEVRMRCDIAPVKSEDKCTGKEQGHCRDGTRCFIKNNPRKKEEIYASCCCNQTSTPIDMIMHERWSCWAKYVDLPEETHGQPPWCSIHCCERPGVMQSCHGNQAICCNEEDESCGITLHGEPCCAAYDKPVNATCCRSLGTTCWHSPASWLVVPFIQGSPCCLENHPEVACGSEETCNQNFVGAMLETTSLVVVAALVQTYFHMKGSGTDMIPGRKWCWYLKTICPALFLALGLHLVVYLNFLSIWTKLTPAQTARVCIWWAIWSLLAMQAIVCAMVNLLRCRAQPATWDLDHFPRGRSGVRILIAINNQDYRGRSWDRVFDPTFQQLVDECRKKGWQVFEWLDLKRNEVDAMLGQVDPHLRGAVQPKVWFYISGHSQMALGCPRFLPADAGSWGDGVSIFKMVRRLSNVTGCREARIHVMLNGCMAFPTGLEKLAWWCKYGFSMQDDDLRLSSQCRLLLRSEAQAWILFACHPGRTVTGSQERGGVFTRKILRVLRDNLGDNDSHLELYYDQLIRELRTMEDGVKFHAFLLTTGTTGNANPSRVANQNDEHEEIPRQPSQESFGTQSTSASSGPHEELCRDPEVADN